MIKLTLDRQDFLCAIEGFARGSHLRQHVWHEIVYKSIPQLSDDDMDFLWTYMFRDFRGFYFHEIQGKRYKHCGADDFFRALAILHRGNRYLVRHRSDEKGHTRFAICYRYNGKYCPLYEGKKPSKKLCRWYCYVPDEIIISVEKQPMPYNRFVPSNMKDAWNDLEMYDKPLEEAFNGKTENF